MNIGRYIADITEQQGRSKVWVAGQCDIKYKTFVDKLTRDSFSAEELIITSIVLGFDLEELKQKFKEMIALKQLLKGFDKLDSNVLVGKFTYKQISELLNEGTINIDLNSNIETSNVTFGDAVIETLVVNKNTVDEIYLSILNGNFKEESLSFSMSNDETSLIVKEGLHQLLAICKISEKIPNGIVDVKILV